jgi:hypothetical protein
MRITINEELSIGRTTVIINGRPNLLKVINQVIKKVIPHTNHPARENVRIRVEMATIHVDP